ncbi:MAG TPA: hypothetical protein VFO18_19450 [Methylomirabilota bacterium]|nr:hypothetical protein [Methylomirabilota bacterium]
MAMILSTHDTGFEHPDDATIAKVLASLDGGHNVLATLGSADDTYVQAHGSVRAGFGVDLQEGSLARRFRTKNRALPLAWVTEVFQRYAKGDLSWRQEVEWEKEEVKVVPPSWWNSWVAYILLMVAVAFAIWFIRGW